MSLGRELPDFVILGAQKSASTFLQDQMGQHPSIEIAAGESRHFEDPEYRNGAVSKLPLLFSRHEPGVVRGIKRPDYLGRPEVTARIARHLPDAKLFVVLRDPISRAVSSYYHCVRHGFVPLIPLTEAFRRLLDGDLQKTYPRADEILTYGLYGQHIERYFQHFNRAQFLIFEQQSLTRDPVGSLADSFRFLGVNPSFRPQREEVSNRGVYSHLRLRFLRSMNHIHFRYTPNLDRRYPRRPGRLGYLWAGTVRNLDRRLLAKLDRTRPPALAPDLTSELRQYYAADLARLRSLLPESESFGWTG